MLLTNSCAPVFSEMQSASTVGEGKMDGTVSYSSVRFSSEDGSDHVQNHADVQFAYGFSENLDLRGRYSSIWVPDEDIRLNLLGFGPKFNFIKDRLSAYLPVGFAFGEGIESSETFQIHPTILGSFPIIDKLEVNPSFKVLVPISGEGESLVAVNLGFGIDIARGVTIRPEYGLLFNPGEDGRFSHFGLGLTFSPADKTMSEDR